MQPFWISLLLASSAAATPLANGVAERDLSSHEVSSRLEARADHKWFRAECWDTTESDSAGFWGGRSLFRYNLWLSKATCDFSGYNWHKSGSCMRDSPHGDLWIDGPQWWNDCKAVAAGGYKDFRRPANDPNGWEEYKRFISENQVEGRAWDQARNAPGK